MSAKRVEQLHPSCFHNKVGKYSSQLIAQLFFGLARYFITAVDSSLYDGAGSQVSRQLPCCCNLLELGRGRTDRAVSGQTRLLCHLQPAWRAGAIGAAQPAGPWGSRKVLAIFNVSCLFDPLYASYVQWSWVQCVFGGGQWEWHPQAHPSSHHPEILFKYLGSVLSDVWNVV